jgi:hypothetical protein
MADQCWSDEKILKGVRRLLKAKGRLSETLLRRSRALPSTSTLHRHFGTYLQLYERVGYHPEAEDLFRGEQCERSVKLRRQLVSTIQELFPSNVAVTHLPGRTRSILFIDDTFMVSILLCRWKRKRRNPHWALEPNPAERTFITLICTLNDRLDRVLDYFLLPNMDGFKRRYFDDSYLSNAVRLHRLTDFYSVVKKLWAERSVIAA